jgi:hypothetical protein
MFDVLKHVCLAPRGLRLKNCMFLHTWYCSPER